VSTDQHLTSAALVEPGLRFPKSGSSSWP